MAHKKLLDLQTLALQVPSPLSFDVATQEAAYFELVAIEESFLKQKFRIKWLNEGDQNSKYFQRVIKGRQPRLKITSLQYEVGTLLTSKQDIIFEFISFYSNFLGAMDQNCDGGSEDFF